MKTLYTAHATANHGREGTAATDDNRLSVILTKPGSSTGTNPEQLFALGYGACFGSAIKAVAASQKLETGEVAVHVDVSLNQDDEGGYFIGANLTVDVPNLDQAAAQALVEKAHTVCPYSKATRGNIEITVKASGQKKAA